MGEDGRGRLVRGVAVVPDASVVTGRGAQMVQDCGRQLPALISHVCASHMVLEDEREGEKDAQRRHRLH
jgi:hypothetical protein